MPDTIINDIERRMRFYSWLLAIGGLVVLIMIAIFMAVVLLLALRVQSDANAVEQAAQQSHNTLCAIEENTTKQIRSSTEYLAMHPNGLVTKDGEVLLSAETIQQGIDRQRAFLDTIRGNIFCEK